MGQGLGPAQRGMLDELARTDEWLALEIKELAAALKLTERRACTVARSLEARGLVVITKEHLGWRGEGEYGHLTKRAYAVNKDAPTALLVKKGEHWPFRRGLTAKGWDVDAETWTAQKDTEFVKAGVPTSGLLVWLPENRRKYVARKIENLDAVGAMFGQPPMTEVQIIKEFGPEYGPA